METDSGPLDDPSDAAALARFATALADAIDAALPGWVERVVARRWRDWSAEPLPVEVQQAASAAGRQALAEASPVLRSLLAADVDAQRDNPLAVLRRAAAHPTRVLTDAGVAPTRRDPQAERLFPDDVFDLGPASFADIDAAVHEPGLVWGAAKAHVVLRRRRSGH